MILRRVARLAVLLMGAASATTPCQAGEPARIEWPVQRLDGTTLPPESIARSVESLMHAARVTGLGVAILNDNEVVYQRAFGLRDADKNLPLNETTVTYAASFTKAMFAYYVMTLVDEGKIDVDRPIVSYCKRSPAEIEKYADLKGDPRLDRLTARHLLSHTSGFANFRFLEPDGKLRFHFEPGARYAYSGEGINLLQLVVEEIAAAELGGQMQARVFDALGMPQTRMIWDASFEADFASGHDAAGKNLGYQRRTSPRAAGSAATTLRDMAVFLRAVMRGQGLSQASKTGMLQPSIRIRSERQFPTLNEAVTDRDDGIKLSYGLGWGVIDTPHGRAWFKEGHADGFQNYMIAFGEAKTGIVLMSNSDNAESIFEELLATLIGDTWSPCEWDGYMPYNAKSK
ncbi:MAG: serine hydrolase domain-containing protein [Phycisphaerales bacterium]